MGSRPQSTRRHAWRVQPVSDTTGDPAYTTTGTRQTILCGYLFNAEAERCALGLGVGEGEECCITLEPIADARLPFSDAIRVSRLHPMLTGVELLCGHRFSATNLLWHWSMSPMVCPMCRATYLINGGVGNRTPGVQVDPMSSALENFPTVYWRLLRGVIAEHTRERALALEQENRAAIVDAVMNDVLTTVFAPVPAFFLMLSFVGIGLLSAHHSVRLQPVTTTETVIGENPLRFSVPRAAMRYISHRLNLAEMAARRSNQPFYMTATIVVGVGTTLDGVAIMLPLTRFDNRVLPVVPAENVRVVPCETVGTVMYDPPCIDTATTTIESISLIDQSQLSVQMEEDVDRDPRSVDEDAVSPTVDAVPGLPGRTVVSMVSTGNTSEIQPGFFRTTIPSNSTLVLIAVSLEACSILTLVAHHVVHDHSSNSF
ncbi:hypothetical protein T484DRAFT_1757979 [Baffinella frigidus]|nr:hypothetical protein T484DRAFT_1757979 [Cryptophyta sp. CCMP2293]